MLTYRREDVTALNTLARSKRLASGALGQAHDV
jgi:hypothetical protein